MSAPQFPALIEHFTRVPPPPPYVHRDARVHSFSLKADRAIQQQLCDAWFDRMSGGAVKYAVLLPKWFVLVANIDQVQPGDPNHSHLGITSEIDVGLWMLVMRTKPLSLVPRWLPVRLLVDSADALVVGREVYGFPKEYGRCSIPSTAPSAGPFVVQGYVTPASNQRMGWHDVIRIRSVGTVGPPQPVWTTVEEATEAVVDDLIGQIDFGMLGGLVTEAALRAGFGLRLLPFVFLKQFMAADQAGRACYQAIVESQTELLEYRRGGFTREQFEVQISSYHTHRFDQLLGIAPVWHRVGHALWGDFDFQATGGTVLHEN